MIVPEISVKVAVNILRGMGCGKKLDRVQPSLRDGLGFCTDPSAEALGYFQARFLARREGLSRALPDTQFHNSAKFFIGFTPVLQTHRLVDFWALQLRR
jgi:hypothetical protein